MKRELRRKIQSGFGLLELMMSAGIAIVISVLVFFAYQAAMNYFNMNKAVDNVNALTAGIRSIFATQGDYNGLTNQVVLSSNSIPEGLRAGNSTSQIKSPWANNGVTVTPANVGGTADDGFTMQYNQVPRNACQDFASKMYRSYTVTVGGTAVTSVATATTACNGTGNVAISFTTR